MGNRRLAIATMWGLAIGGIVLIAILFEPPAEDGTSRSPDDAPLFGPGDLLEGGSRLDLPVGPDEPSSSLYRGGRRNTGRSPFRGPSEATLLWRAEVGARITAQPVLNEAGGVVVGAHDGALHAFDADGQRLWRAHVQNRIWAAAGIDGASMIYVGSDADTFFAFDPEGEIRWTIPTDGDADGPINIAHDGTIHFAAGSDLYAVSSEGQVHWRFRAEGPFLLSAPAIDSDGTLYIGSVDNHLYAISSSGRMRWSYEADEDISSSPLIGDDGTIYFGSDDHHIHALDRDGQLRWRRDMDGYVRAPLALGRDGGLLVGVYGPRPRVSSLDADTGVVRWEFSVSISASSEEGVASGPLVDVDGNIYFGAHDEQVYSLSPLGALRWIESTGGDVDSSPVLRDDGVLVVGADDGFLYAIGQRDEETVDAGPRDEETVDAGPLDEETVDVGGVDAGNVDLGDRQP